MATFTITQSNPNDKTVKIYPDASGCSTGLTPSTGSNYACVGDNDNYVSMATSDVLRDLYDVTNQSDLGTIKYVNINTTVKSVNYDLASSGYCKAQLNFGTCTNYLDYTISVTQSYTERVSLINTLNRNENPFPEIQWAWSDFDDIQVGVSASSPTRDVVSSDILTANSDCTALLGGDLCVPTDAHYTAINEYPIDIDNYFYKGSSLGYVDRISVLGSTQDDGEGDIEVSANDIIHVMTDKYLQAFTFNSSTGTLALQASVTLIDDGYGYGNSISVVTNGSTATDYVLVAYSERYTLEGYSYDISSATYVLEDTDIAASGNYSDSCQDGTFHYVVRDSIEDLRVIEFPDGSGNITIKDSQVIPNNPDALAVMTDGTYVYTVGKDGGSSITAYSIDGSGNITIKDTATNAKGMRAPFAACIDIGSETLIFLESYDGESGQIFSFDHSTNVAFEAYRSTGVSGDGTNKYGRKFGYEEDGKYYIGMAVSLESALRLYQVDTSTPDLDLIATRNACTTGVESGDGCNFMGFTTHVFDGRRIFLSNSNYLYAYQWKDYYDSYNFTNPGTLGTVANVKINFVANNYCGDDCNFIVHIFSSGSEATSTIVSSENADKLLTATFTVDPNTSSAWTQSAVSNIIAGVEIMPNHDTACSCNNHRVSQVYLEVNHTVENISPEIRVKEQYLTVGYTPTSNTCTLNIPETVSSNHARNIKMLNFWDGSRAVYDYNRSGKSLVLRGKEYENSACSTIVTAREMAENGATITVTGLSFAAWNRDYKIRSFGWKRVSKKPDTWEWILELEEDDITEEC